jgi:dethiobiotin synthetase
MKTVFVAGAGTDVGKTYVACALIRALRRQGRAIDALKPAASGFDPDRLGESDPGRLLEALGRAPTAEALDAICPLRFEAALAPPSAARREGRTLDFEAVLEPCRARLERADVDVLLIEGAGGVMSPIADRATNVDLIKALGVPVLLVGGSYLGAMTHSLTALEVLKARGCKSLALVVSESPDGVDLDETVAELRPFTGEIPIIALQRSGEIDPGDMLQFPDRAR